jgi:hypothetical protein
MEDKLKFIVWRRRRKKGNMKTKDTSEKGKGTGGMGL